MKMVDWLIHFCVYIFDFILSGRGFQTLHETDTNAMLKNLYTLYVSSVKNYGVRSKNLEQVLITAKIMP